MKKWYALSLASLLMLTISCSKDNDESGSGDEPDVVVNKVPEFFKEDFSKTYGQKTPTITLIADAKSKIEEPQDLDFNPHPFRPNELWIINKGTENTGGSTVMLTEVGTPTQKFDHRQDGNAWHFMSLPSAISFSHNGNWATAHNVLDANHQGGTFTGPTLWSADLDVYAKYAGPGTNGSHLDMLHGSPYGMGIESFLDNSFWVFDGYHSQIVFYDFSFDHGPGNHDHSDGKIHRYVDFSVKRDPMVPSHLVYDKNTWLYIVDGGNRRILRLNVYTGKTVKVLPNKNEPLKEHLEKGETTWEELIPESYGLVKPCGIELAGNRLFVSDYETGMIICYDINTKRELGRINTGNKGIMGIKIGPDKKIYFVNALKNAVYRVDPN